MKEKLRIYLALAATVSLVTMTNCKGLCAEVTNYGATLVAMRVPDRNAKLADITLGFDSIEPYIKDCPYFGATGGLPGTEYLGSVPRV
jgi:aldose 1-epimerase